MNKVVHFEIPYDDRERSKKFYTTVFGWNVQDMPFEDDVYTFAITAPIDENYMIKEPGAINGGIVKRNESVSAPVITIEVSSIDEHIPKIEAAGGKMIVPKGEVPEMGYYAYFKDTEGNILGLWESLRRD